MIEVPQFDRVIAKLKAVGWWCPECKLLRYVKSSGCACFNDGTEKAKKSWKRVYILKGE